MTSDLDPSENSTVDTEIDGTTRVWFRRRLSGRQFAGLLVATALVAVAIWQGVATSPTSDSSVLSGRSGAPATGFTLKNVTNPAEVISLRTFRGQPLVINFWASWCVPCRLEMPLLEKAYRAEAGKVAFLGIDTNDTSSAARKFLTQVHVTYPTAFDPNGSVATSYGLFGLPTTYFISPEGKILGRHIGQMSAATLKAALHEAFGV